MSKALKVFPVAWLVAFLLIGFMEGWDIDWAALTAITLLVLAGLILCDTLGSIRRNG